MDLEAIQELEIETEKVGPQGYSAYEVAVQNGFEGTEEEWLESLKGADGIEGGSGTPTDVQINGTSITSSGTANIVTEGVYNSATNKLATMSALPDVTGKQDTLVSGTNIKTINNQSILGSGNITVEGGSGSTSGLSDDIKAAILNCFENVAWINDDGQDYYDALEFALYPPDNISSISAVFNQGQAVIYDNASLDDLKQYLTVTALYDDNTTETVTNYSLSGTLTAGTSTVTVTYQGKTTTFTVNVTAVPTLSSITATYTQSGAVYTTDSLDSLKANLVVKAIYSDSSEATLEDSDYTLSGTLSVGTSTITVSYSGKTTTFNVTVSQAVELSSISAVYTQSETIYTSDSLNDLKSDLVVTATYSDSSTRTIAASDYTLSGTLTAGTSTITVTYEGKTTTFSVTVTAVVVSSIDAVFTQGTATITTNNSLDDLKQYLVVTATYNNGTTSTVASADYTLSGTLTEGTSTITVTYEGKTDTFDVTVSQVADVWQDLTPSMYTATRSDVTINSSGFIHQENIVVTTPETKYPEIMLDSNITALDFDIDNTGAYTWLIMAGDKDFYGAIALTTASGGYPALMTNGQTGQTTSLPGTKLNGCPYGNGHYTITKDSSTITISKTDGASVTYTSSNQPIAGFTTSEWRFGFCIQPSSPTGNGYKNIKVKFGSGVTE